MPRFRLLLPIVLLFACTNSEAGPDSLAPGGGAGGETGGGSGGEGSPYVVEDFSTYSSTEQMRSDPRRIYNLGEDINVDRVVLDPSTSPPGQKQSMRYDFPVGGAQGFFISRQLALPRSTSEVWVEFSVRFAPGFSLEAGYPGDSAFKLFFVNIDGSAGRFGIGMEGGDHGLVDAGGPDDDFEAMLMQTKIQPASLFDGGWHTFRFHARIGATDFYEMWVDGASQGSRTGHSDVNNLRAVTLGRNMNQGPKRPQSMNWGRVIIHTTDPKW